MSLFISEAMAADVPAAPAGSDTFPLIFLVGIMAIFYFTVWRPQSKRTKEHKELLTNLQKGDEVVTTGGLLGKVTKVADEFVALQMADNVELKVQKAAISAVLPKGTMKSI